jgi:hypothetical protein
LYCPSCRNQILEHSAFCLHCGKPINPSASTPSVTEWEYETFIYRFPPHHMRARSGISLDTRTEARRKFWKNSKDKIWTELQQWLDSGWEPVEKVGPSCVEMRTDHALAENAILLLLAVILGPWIGGGGQYLEPTTFRLRMRRSTGRATVPHKYTRLKAELEQAQSERRELEAGFAYRLGRFINSLLSRRH